MKVQLVLCQRETEEYSFMMRKYAKKNILSKTGSRYYIFPDSLNCKNVIGGAFWVYCQNESPQGFQIPGAFVLAGRSENH